MGSKKVHTNKRVYGRFKLHLKTIIFAFLGVFLILSTFIMCLVYQTNKEHAERLSKVADTKLVGYEADIPVAMSAAQYFSVCDQSSYKAFIANAKLTSDVKAQYFPDNRYDGTDTSSPVVSVPVVQYEYNPGVDYKNYMMIVNVKRSNGTVQYHMLVTVNKEYITNMEIY